MADAMAYHHRQNQYQQDTRRDMMMQRDSSTSTLLTREQQLREEIARLKREEQELCEKDIWVKQTIMAVREKIAAEKRIY
ncbi:hypothetical protein CU098_013572 [Rhizopus stolonifer]|uniref:Uncharacterized protein n=2 Tax=Mucorineae TaxID=1344963 RepID=A0A367KXQ9_RHIST|nr:hypothetical protein CU098_013572 [Rhizopus stolonifer]